MKYLFLSQTLLCLCLACMGQFSGSYILEGKIDAYAAYKGDVYVYLTKGAEMVDGQFRLIYDSVKLVKGRFSFSGTIEQPVMQTLMLKHPGEGEEKADLWLEKGRTGMSTSKYLKDASYKGTALNAEYFFLFPATDRISRMNDSLYFAGKRLDSAKAAFMDDMFNSFGAFIERFPASFHSVSLLSGLAGTAHREREKGRLQEERLVKLEALNQKVQEHNKGVMMDDLNLRIKGLRSNGLGAQVQHFALAGINGDTIDTRALMGKVYLIDFWGSWCVWCRRGHPHLKELYETYQSKGFEIVAVAKEFGTTAEQWEKWKCAVKEDQLPWLHVMNGDGALNMVEAFGITAYPTKILVDRNGKVVLRVTDDDEKKLDAKLAELLN